MRNAGSEIDSVAQQPIADQRGADQDRAGDDAGAHRDAAARRARQVFGHGEEGRRQPDRIDHDEERQQRRNCIVERHGGATKIDAVAHFSGA